ncbi:uncharacterized protein LOC143428103 isoform X2 [Xylocopa sonorina]|uniref:uncharacterized protein LOC143428103 isoform X2 n=1 Tax=Xylocopa sonorina TaxID=1818115 RepID=UPI00403AEBB4
MKEFGSYQSNATLKNQRERLKKQPPQKSPIKLLTKDCRSNVIISRDNTIYKRTNNFSESSNLSSLDDFSSKLQVKKEKVSCEVEHLYCDKNNLNFEDERDVCLISSSSEIHEDAETCESLSRTGDSLMKLNNNLTEENGYDCSLEENVIFEASNQKWPIFVDLTTDEKNTWKQTILKRFCDVKTNTVNGNEAGTKDVTLEPRIMIADSSSKLNCSSNQSLATALRDHGPCSIPIQPNRCLPIRPAPRVPTRYLRKGNSHILPKSTALDVVKVESVNSVGTPPNEEIPEEKDVNSLSQMTSKESADNIKGTRKKRRSQGADSSQNKEKRVESSIKEFLTNFCGSNANGEIQNRCTDKCAKVVDKTTKEECSNKLVPPLRLKKVVRTRAKDYSNARVTTVPEHESNYRIITGKTPQPSSNPNSTDWTNIFCEKNTRLVSSNTDSYKLKYRRNRLKQKLRELRSKALDLSKQMSNNSSSEQSTRLRQVMNRYEKQIENLSKLHSKLSAAIPASTEVIDLNDNSASPASNKHTSTNLNDTSEVPSENNSCPASSPEPPKLSPRSPLSCDNILPQEIRDSPPILPRVSLAITSSQDSVVEELQVTEKKVWLINEDSIIPHPTNSIQLNFMDNDTLNVKEHSQTALPHQQNNINVDLESSDIDAKQNALNHCRKLAQFPEDSPKTRKKKNEGDQLTEVYSQYLRPVIQKSEQDKYLNVSNPRPLISSITSAVELPTVVQENEMIETVAENKLIPPKECTLQSNPCESSWTDTLFPKINEDDINSQRVTSSSAQSTQLDVSQTILSQKRLTLQQNYKREEIPTDSAQKSDSNYSITEQFPTLGNWFARISKKQNPRGKSKLQYTGKGPFATTETSTRLRNPGSEIRKIVKPSTSNDVMNTTQGGTERWQYHHQQQQRQQLLQHVAASVNLSQPVATVPPVRPNIYPPIPMTQFYLNNYAVDPYNNATLNYHPAIFPYGPTYPYQSRIHSNTLPGYNFPMQESLRPMQHMDKRFPPIQDPIIRYPSTSTNSLQHPNNLEFDRLQNQPTATNVGNTTCLPSLFLSPQSLSSSHQTLPRAPPVGYATNSQFSRNRMIPDVVAAAAAAAVVAAASFDRQCDTLTYTNKASTDALSTAGITNVIDRESIHMPESTKLVSRDVINQTQNSNFNEECQKNSKYKNMQHFLFDRMVSVKTADNFAQTKPITCNDTQAAMASIVSAPYRVPLIPSHTQLPKNDSGNGSRNCETPHLGKVNRSPNSSYNFTCSNCGTIGPKFKCLGCEMVFYCDERCQEKHWCMHVQKCPKKMPKLKKVT